MNEFNSFIHSLTTFLMEINVVKFPSRGAYILGPNSEFWPGSV